MKLPKPEIEPGRLFDIPAITGPVTLRLVEEHLCLIDERLSQMLRSVDRDLYASADALAMSAAMRKEISKPLNDLLTALGAQRRAKK